MSVVVAARAASAEPTDNVQRAQFTTDASAQQVEGDACSLTKAFLIEGRARTWDVSVGGRRCSAHADADAIPLLVTITTMDARAYVTLAATPSDDVPEPSLRIALTSTAKALRDARPPVAQPVQPATRQQQASSGPSAGTVAAVAATAGGVTAAVVVAVVVGVVVAVVAGFAALFAAIGKGL